jgi:hypothetical protein
LFVGILMHVSITACTLVLTPQTTGVLLLAYGLAFAAAMWAVIAAVGVGHRRPLSDAALGRRVA